MGSWFAGVFWRWYGRKSTKSGIFRKLRFSLIFFENMHWFEFKVVKHMQTITFDELDSKIWTKNFWGPFLAHFSIFWKKRKIFNLQRPKAPKNFQNHFLPMGGGLKYHKRIKTQLLRSTGPRKIDKRKYKSLNEFRGQNDPPLVD